jgi:hypothetical protein
MAGFKEVDMDIAEQINASKLDRIIEELDGACDRLPREAIEAARKCREQIIPRLIEAIEAATNTAAAGGVAAGNAHFFGLFLLAEFEAVEALPAILKSISLSGELPEDLFDDALTEILDRALVSMAPGLEVIDELIGNRELNRYVRWAAVDSYPYFVHQDRITRDEAVDRLRDHLRTSIDASDEPIVSPLICALAKFAPAEARDEIARAYQLDLVEEFVIRLKDVEGDIREGWSKERLRSRCRRLPIDALDELESYYSFSESGPTGPSVPQPHFHSPAEPSFNIETIVRPTVRVGRNDPCPCGSGKKFKKCCGSRG